MQRSAFLFTVVGLMVAASPAYAAGLFGMLEIKADKIQSLPKWTDVLSRIRNEDLYGHCAARDSDCDGKREDWYTMVQRLQNEDADTQMRGVNRWANNYPYITDGRLWGKSDYWETPGQFVDRSGDCEDYALIKYYTLKQMGWSESSLRLAVVHDAVRDIPHAILAVKLGGVDYILDNLAREPLPDRYVKQYTPYYAVNANSRWVFIKPMRE